MTNNCYPIALCDDFLSERRNMTSRKFARKHKEETPVLAICYDFDKTLSPDDMQAQGYIQSVGFDVGEFWTASNGMAESNDMDQNLAYMYKMMQEADGRIVFNKDKLRDYGAQVKLFPGVEAWFERIREYGREHGVIVEHYIISSGLKEMIEGTTVAKNGAFERIYASSFYFENGRSAKWPAQVVNYTNKTQFLFRIEKGVLDINDPGVNDYFPPDKIRVPFRNMVYIGDSDTDIPCMKLVSSHGGHAIGVYNPETKEKDKVYKMMREKRINYFVPSDYSEGAELDSLVKLIIDKTVATEKLERIHDKNLKETVEVDKHSPKGEQKKIDMLIELEESFSFSRTHQVIAKLSEVSDWTSDQVKRLFKIATQNSQVYSILKDDDVKLFYKGLASKYKLRTEEYFKVIDKIN